MSITPPPRPAVTLTSTVPWAAGWLRRRNREAILQLRPILRHHEGIHGKFLFVAMQHQLEPIREQRLNHLGKLCAGGALRQFGGDIEVLGRQPVRAQDLINRSRGRPFGCSSAWAGSCTGPWRHRYARQY